MVAVLDVHFVYLGAAVGALGQATYVVDTLRGRVQPNRVTWLLWGVAPLLAFAVELSDGVGLRSLMTFTVGFGPCVVFAASFFNPASVWRLHRLDYVCGGLSVAGTFGWLLTRQGLVALGAALAADALAAVPTVVKTWNHPESESVSVYLGAFVNATITLLTVTTISAAEVAFPLYIAVVATVQLVLLTVRPRARLRAALVGGSDVE